MIILKWISQHWSPISVVLSLFFAGFGVYIATYEKKPHISIDIVSETNVLDVRQPVRGLAISFQGDDLQDKNLNLRVVTVRVSNDGEVDILQSTFDKDDTWGL